MNALKVVAAVALLYGIVGVIPTSAAEELITLPTRSGVTQSFYVTMPAGPPAPARARDSAP